MQVKKRFLAIDYGEKRIGIAITDPLRLFAYPLITFRNDSKFWQKFLDLLHEYDIELIILGYPLKENGEKSTSTSLVEEFYQRLISRLDKQIILVDERYSSEIAKNKIIESVSSKKKRRSKGLVDMNAAAVILQDYLNELESGK